MIRINQIEHSWGDILIWVAGQPIYGCRGVSYNKKKEKQHLHAAGRDPRAIQHGKRTPDGDVTLIQSAVAAMNRAARAAGYRDFLDVDADIVVTYLSEDKVLSADRIVCASFSEIPKGMKEGDPYMEITLPFLCLDIIEDAA